MSVSPLEKDLQRSLTSLLRISERLNSTSDPVALLNALVEELLELTGAESGCAGLRRAEGMLCDHFFDGSRLVPLPNESRYSSGWSDWVLTHGIHYLANNAAEDKVIEPKVRARFHIRSGMSIPIFDRNKDVIAFFELYNKRSAPEVTASGFTAPGFTANDLKDSLAAAQIASLAIQNGVAHRNLKALGEFSRSLTMASDLDQILDIIGRHLEMNFHPSAVILLPAGADLALRFQTREFLWNPTELEAATECWKRVQKAGASTSIVPDAHAEYHPLTVGGRVVGVLGLDSRPGAWFSQTQRELLVDLTGQSALAIERGLLEEKVHQLRFVAESDRVQNALLTAISHEVRAPLAAITAAVRGLLSAHVPLDKTSERQVLETAEYEVKRLHRLMNNLLSVTRLEVGMARVRLEPCDLSDVVGAALEELGSSAQKRQILLDIPSDLPLVLLDFDLITQVLVNLFSNALKFSPADAPIQLHSRIVDDNLEVSVVDQGIGVPEADLERVFQKFQRLTASSSADGLGLGLSICKEFVESHGGQIRLEHNPAGGTIARFIVPVRALATII